MDFYDVLFAKKLGGGGGSSVDVESLSVTENGTYTAPEGKAYSPVSVNVSQPKVVMKDVNFYDYDGTLLHSYTKTEWASVTELPSNPSHEKLTAQGWNWTKAEIDAQLTTMPDCPVHVGQHYISASGDTEIDFELIAPRLSPYLGISLNGTVEVDWGDGNTLTVSATNIANLKNTQHTYANEGEYTIKIHRTSGVYSLGATNSANSKQILNNNDTTLNNNSVYSTSIKAIRIGDLGTGGGVANYAFSGVEMQSIPVPKDLTENTNGFSGSRFEFLVLPRSYTNQSDTLSEELHTVCLPPTATAIALSGKYYLRNLTFVKDAIISSQGLRNCYELRRAYITPNATTINAQSFRACYSLATLTVPSGVTSIGSLAFGDCKGLGAIHMLPTTPPTVSNDDALNSLPTSCVIYVPSASLSDYQTASIWSNYASRMQGE